MPDIRIDVIEVYPVCEIEFIPEHEWGQPWHIKISADLLNKYNVIKKEWSKIQRELLTINNNHYKETLSKIKSIDEYDQ